MPDTGAPWALPFEALTDQPTKTLNGGSDGLSPILAQEVHDALNEVAGDISDVDTRLTVVEAGLAASKWRDLGGGVESGAAFQIPVPAGFEILRLFLFGDLDGNGTVRLRLNGDATAGLHNTSILSRDGNGTAVDATYSNNATAWFLANWGTVSGNTAEVTIYALNASGAPTYRSFGERMSALENGHIESRCWGHLDADRTVTSLDIRPFSDVANLFATCHWRLEGRLV